MQIDLGVSEVRTADSVLVQHVKSRKFLGSTSGQFADVSPIVLTYDLSSQSSSLDDFNEEIKNEWKFEFGVLLDSAPTTHKCLIKNAVSEEFFGPDPYFFETELHDVELCTTLLQKDSSEWNAELWCDDGNAGESAADRRGSVKFVLRNAFTLKYLCVVDRETTWADSPTIDCVFTVSGPGARPISDRLRPPPLDPVALRRFFFLLFFFLFFFFYFFSIFFHFFFPFFSLFFSIFFSFSSIYYYYFEKQKNKTKKKKIGNKQCHYLNTLWSGILRGMLLGRLVLRLVKLFLFCLNSIILSG